ncbi:AAA family ATPase [Haladaptatus sp. SPP-AMP-3]|uniref:AAA family ATPase n=1 Tax=Haladaptatus sp. SPP-AMP-3 TaxID=3121295 RepID=UPI003C2E5D7A
MMDNVQIFELKLQDYRQYEGETIIPLETTDDENINVIVGQNGAGKSNILNAITLCFYGEEAHTDAHSGDSLKSDPYVNIRRLDSLSPGESAEGFVEIKLGKDDPEYAFRRSFTTARKPDDDESGEPQYNNSLGELKLRQRFGGNDWQPIPQPENILREILPTHVHQYFLFDGEQLDEFFAEGYAPRVKKAVLDVSHVELLNNAVEHLNVIRQDFERESSDIGGDVAELQKRKEKAEQELGRLEKKRNDLTSELETAKTKVEGINDDLSASGDEDVRDMQQRREFLDGKLDEKENQLTEARAQVGTSLAQAGGVAYNADALTHAISAIEEYESTEDGLPGLTEELLDSILTRGKCLCGTNLSEVDDARGHIEDLLKENSSNGHQVIDGRLRMTRTLKQGESLIDDLIADKSKVEEIRNWIDDKEAELSRISLKLEDEDTIDNEEAVKLEKQRQRLSGRVNQMSMEIGELNGEIKQQNGVIEERRQEWRKAMKKQRKNERLVHKSVFVESASDTLEHIKHDILDKVRTQTEHRLERYYNDLIWKDEDYEVALTEDYEVKLYNQDGRKNLGSLAAGERQVLALAFMAALSKISGFSAPIVIDTPLGRISSDPKRLIAQNVPNYLEDTQVTFLMTDVEYSDDVRAFITDEVAYEYHLDYHDGITEVVEQ